MLKCFEQHGDAHEKEPDVHAIALNGAAIINTLKSGQFEQSQEPLDVSSENPSDFHHHDQMESVQKTFITQVKFKDYATDAFLPCVRNRLQKVQRIDVSWDSYFNYSLQVKT